MMNNFNGPGDMPDNLGDGPSDMRPKPEQTEPVKPPSFFQMAKTFAKELATYVANGSPNVTQEAYMERLEVCNNCEYLIKDTMRCGSCGCLLEHKAKWKTSDCPKSKWAKENLTKDEEKVIEEQNKKAEEYVSNNMSNVTTSHKEYTPEEWEKIHAANQKKAQENAKRQEDNNTDSSN